jgi:hypothetical protein
MRTAFILCLALAGCHTCPPTKTETVTKTVREFIPLPAWATAPVPNAPPINFTVDAVTKANNRRAEWLDYVNCRSRALDQLGAGKKISDDVCKKPK